MESYKSKEYSRNYGFWNEEEQKKLNESRVSIAGVGGDGFQLGHKLAMMGILNFSVADPETFEEENSNRVFGAKSSTYGKNKAEVFRDMVMDIRPDANVDIYTDGVNEDNIDEFVGKSDLVFDESELTHLELGAMIARKAREKNIPNIWAVNIGFSGVVTSFNPSTGITFEDMMGIPKGAPLDEIKDMTVDFGRCLPYLPKYGDIESLLAVQNGASLPSISQGVDIASALGSTEAFLHLTSDVRNNRRQPIWAPKFRYMDAYTGKSGIIRNARLSFYLGIAAMSTRLKLGINPLGSYSDQDRLSREK